MRCARCVRCVAPSGPSRTAEGARFGKVLAPFPTNSMPRSTRTREAALEERLDALRSDPAARQALDRRVTQDQRERREKLRWDPLLAERAQVGVVPSISIPRAASPGMSTGRSSRSFASNVSEDTDVDPVGGWKQYFSIPSSHQRGRQTLSDVQPPLKFGFESEADRRREQQGLIKPLACSAAQEEPLLASARLGTAPHVELVHSPLPNTLRPPSRRCERGLGVGWRPATAQAAWSSTALAPPPKPPEPVAPLVLDDTAALARASERASRPPSPRMGALQQAAKENSRRIRNHRAADRLAQFNPLSDNQIRSMPSVQCRRGTTFHRIRMRSFDAMSESVYRAERSVISTRLSSARSGAKRFLA